MNFFNVKISNFTRHSFDHLMARTLNRFCLRFKKKHDMKELGNINN